MKRLRERRDRLARWVPSDGMATVIRFVVTVVATGLLVVAVLGPGSLGGLGRGVAAIVGGGVLLLVAGAWFDAAVGLLAAIVAVAAWQVANDSSEPKPDEPARPTVLVRVSLNELQQPARSLGVGESIVLVTVVQQARRTLVRRHDVQLEEPVCATTPPGDVLVAIERGDKDATLVAIARDAALARRTYAVATAPAPGRWWGTGEQLLPAQPAGCSPS